MVFLQTELPPSMASGSNGVKAGGFGAVEPAVKAPTKLLSRMLLSLFAFALLVVVGYFAAKTTESVAVGILASDLSFLIAVAGWSSVAGGARR